MEKQRKERKGRLEMVKPWVTLSLDHVADEVGMSGSYSQNVALGIVRQNLHLNLLSNSLCTAQGSVPHALRVTCVHTKV